MTHPEPPDSGENAEKARPFHPFMHPQYFKPTESRPPLVRRDKRTIFIGQGNDGM